VSRVLPVLKGLLPRLQRKLFCESCGQEFSCGASLRGCWCADIPLNEKTRTQLRQTYSDCLCRTCLERFAAAEKDEVLIQRTGI
jgi:hypothetical protein